MYGQGDIINDRYEIEDVLFGGMAVVYVVFDRVDKRRVALKTPKDDFLRNDDVSELEWRSRFEREARNWKSLGLHQNIVQAIAIENSGNPILTLEYVDGYDLEKILKYEPGGLATIQALGFAVQIAEGLAHAHTSTMPRGSGGLIHRDLKPSNVLVTRACLAKLTDFGLSLAMGDTRWTKCFVGSLAYAPPEQFENAHSVTQKADIYSFGVILYEMITGNLPFTPCEVRKMVLKIFYEEPEPIETYTANVAPALRDLILQCLSKRPNARPESALVLVKELHSMLESLPADTGNLSRCSNCGYLPKKEHVSCPVCDHPNLSANSGNEEQSWKCACGLRVPLKYRFCMSCGLPCISPNQLKRTTRISSSLQFSTLDTFRFSDSGKLCLKCGKQNPYTSGSCSWCGSLLSIDDVSGV